MGSFYETEYDIWAGLSSLECIGFLALLISNYFEKYLVSIIKKRQKLKACAKSIDLVQVQLTYVHVSIDDGLPSVAGKSAAASQHGRC